MFRTLLLSLATLCCIIFSPLLAQTSMPRYDTPNLLKQLDSAIEHKASYHLQREHRIQELRTLASIENDTHLPAIYKSLYNEYSSYQSDSALFYLRLIEKLPSYHSDPSIQLWTRISYAKSYAVMGLYNYATSTLRQVDTTQIDTEIRLYHAQIARAVYGWIHDYSHINGHNDLLYAKKVAQYRSSILSLENDSINRNIVLVDKINKEAQDLMKTSPTTAQEKLHKATRISMADLREADINQKIYIYNNLAETYGLLNDNDAHIYYLCLTAICDIQKGVTEYMALPQLALALYEQGDIKRAYRYMICAMEDANFCKARLRTIEATSYFPIIDRAYRELETSQHSIEKKLIYVLSIFAFFLAAILFCLYLQMKKLHLARKELAMRNTEMLHTGKQLSHAIQELKIADKAKDEYIARYLARCRGNLDTLDEYRRSLYRLAKERKLDELFKQLKSESLVREEQEKFFTDFDEAFLLLFPKFIEKFNALLDPETPLVPKNDELLSPELRIFALIRLGVHDSARIAHFLNYSLTTIYNYRSKIKGRAIVPKEEFEKRVMEL